MAQIRLWYRLVKIELNLTFLGALISFNMDLKLINFSLIESLFRF